MPLLHWMLGFFTTRYKIRGTNLLTTLSVLALLSPTFIGAYSWITMLGNNGFLRNLLASIGLKLPPIYGPAGIILADALQYYPFISLMLAGSLMTIDRSLEEASENLGARSIKTFFNVTLPLVLPSLTGGALIVFMMSLSNFGTPAIIERYHLENRLGGRPRSPNTVAMRTDIGPLAVGRGLQRIGRQGRTGVQQGRGLNVVGEGSGQDVHPPPRALELELSVQRIHKKRVGSQGKEIPPRAARPPADPDRMAS